MPIDHDALRAPYLQLADLLRKGITDGTYEPGTKLPSLVELEAEHGLNAKTIRKALDVLRGEGLVETSPGRGTYVKPPASEETGG